MLTEDVPPVINRFSTDEEDHCPGDPQAPADPARAGGPVTLASMWAAGAPTPRRVLARRKAFLAKWKLRCRPVATSLEEAGERLLTFVRYPPEQWRSLRTTNAIERLHEEFKRRIKTRERSMRVRLLPCAETAAMLFWALLASGQITMRRVDGWQSLERAPADLDLAA